MRSIVLAIFMLLSVSAISQTHQDSINRANRAHTDSVIGAQERRTDSLQRAEDIDRNLQSLMRIQEENRKKQKKAAMIRIGIGVLFLGLLIFGLMRRRKQKK